MNLLKYNRHWEKNYRYPYLTQRMIFKQLADELHTRQIIEITGLRRTGKTTLLFQLLNHLLDSGQSPFSLWYFTFDEERPHLDELLNAFARQTQLDIKSEKIFVFLDEIQKLPNFQNQIKVYFDLYPNLKFYISGSTSLFIRKKSQESLAGRIKSLFLTPLNFKEYLTFVDSLEILDRPLLFQNEILNHFEIFLNNQFIESLSIPDLHAKRDYYVTIMRKIIFEDIPSTFSVSNPEILWQIMRIIAQKPGIIIDYQNIANDLGVSNKTISSYFYFLEEAFLIKKMYNFSRNLISSEKKLKRFYLSSPSFSWALTDFHEIGHLIENLAVSLKNYQFFWRDAYHHEVDFIDIQNESDIVPIEFKYSDSISSKDLRNIFLFANKFNCSRALVYMKTIEETTSQFASPEIKIIYRPIFLV